MDALDAHPGKGRKEEVVQQPCNHRAEKLPRNRRERDRKTERFYNFILNKTVLKKWYSIHILQVYMNLNVYVEMYCYYYYFHFHKINYLQVK